MLVNNCCVNIIVNIIIIIVVIIVAINITIQDRIGMAMGFVELANGYHFIILKNCLQTGRPSQAFPRPTDCFPTPLWVWVWVGGEGAP